MNKWPRLRDVSLLFVCFVVLFQGTAKLFVSVELHITIETSATCKHVIPKRCSDGHKQPMAIFFLLMSLSHSNNNMPLPPDCDRGLPNIMPSNVRRIHSELKKDFAVPKGIEPLRVLSIVYLMAFYKAVFTPLPKLAPYFFILYLSAYSSRFCAYQRRCLSSCRSRLSIITTVTGFSK